jgi:hypothetical protein
VRFNVHLKDLVSEYFGAWQVEKYKPEVAKVPFPYPTSSFLEFNI